MSDADHSKALNDLAALAATPGWLRLCAFFDVEMKEMGDRVLSTKTPDDEANKLRRVREALVESWAPGKVLETLQNNHRAAAKRELREMKDPRIAQP
jgi:hypothetical protein